MEIKVSPTKILKILLTLIAIFLLFNFFYILTKYFLVNEFLSSYLNFFYVDNERSFPTVFSGIQLFVSAIILYVISLDKELKKVQRGQWRGLSFIFLFLTIDELISIHETLISITHDLIEITSDYLTFAWVIPYGFALIILFFLYFDFVRTLPSKTRTLFLISGIIFCSGAIGIELLGGKIYSQIGQYSLEFAISCSVEETLEMLGICLFIYALLNHLLLHVVNNQNGYKPNEQNKKTTLRIKFFL